MLRVILLLMHICIIHGCDKVNFIKEQDVEFKDHVITTMTTPYVEICWDKCVWTMNCFSINVRNTRFGTVECDLNNSSKKASPGSLVTTQGSQYHQMGDTKECDRIGCTIIKEDLGVGWYRINDAAVKMIHENKTWIDARAHCQSQGADLASIKTNYEKLFIIDLMLRSMTSKGNEIALPINDLPGLLKDWTLEGTDGDVELKGTPSPRYEVVDGEKALYLPGFKGYAEVPAVVMNPEGYTFMLWIKPANQSIVTTENVYSDWSDLHRFYLQLSRGNKAVYIRVKKQDGGTIDAAYAYIDMNGWNHLAVTWNETVGKVRITVNGTEQVKKDYVPILPKVEKPYHLGVLGVDTPNVPNNNAFHGHVRQLMVFNNSMTDQEIQEAMTLPTNDLPGLWKYWALRGTDEDVELKGTPSPRYEVANGEKALYLPGFKGYAEVPAVVMNPEGYTFMLWIKPANQSIVTTENVYSDWSDVPRFYLQLSRGNKAVYIRVKKEDGGTIDAAYAYIDMNGWNHIAVTWNKTVGKVRITVNGTEQVNRDYFPILPKIEKPYHLGVVENQTPNVPNNNAFHGHMRHLMVFNNSMTDQEIQAAMNYGQQGFWIGLNALNDTSTFKWSDGTNTKTMVPPDQFKDSPTSYWPRCAAVARDGKWIIKICNDLRYFVCRKPFP